MSSNNELYHVMRTQMGIDPEKCDKATIELFKKKFFGDGGKDQSDKKTKKKHKKQRKPSGDNDEDDTALLMHHREEDIHMPKQNLKKNRGSAFNKNNEGQI